MKTFGCYIDGAFEDGQGAIFTTLNPATGETFAQGNEASFAQADRAIAAARRAASAGCARGAKVPRTGLSYVGVGGESWWL